MTVFLLTFGLFLLVVVAMAVGYLVAWVKWVLKKPVTATSRVKSGKNGWIKRSSGSRIKLSE